MDKGGTLTIRARLPEETTPVIDRRQRIPKLFSDIYNEITISDTGVGMTSETLNNMYNPFFTTKSNGTGLGLSIVYQINFNLRFQVVLTLIIIVFNFDSVLR